MTAGKRVAVLGLGIMGTAIAKNLCAAGFSVSGWNRHRETALPLLSYGAKIADSAAAAVAEAEMVITMLSDGAAIEATIDSSALQTIEDGAVWIQMSTIGIAATERLRQRAASAGVAFVDAPVLGTRQPAEQAQLVILASGAPELEPICAPIFAAISARVLWLGAAGLGTRLKLVANQWSTGMVAVLAETVTLARTLGVAPKAFFELIEPSVFNAPYAQAKGALMAAGEFPTSFPLAWAHKDVCLALAAAEGAGQDLPVTKAIRRQFAAAESGGHARADLSAVITALRAGTI